MPLREGLPRPRTRRPSGLSHFRRRFRGFEPLEERTLFTLEGNQIFPLDSPWNRRVDAAPVATNSATLVSNIGASSRVHPDFGTIYEGAYIGIPFNVVSGTQPKIDVVLDAYADESDDVPVPIPAGAIIEGDPLPSGENNGDRHLIVYDKDNNILYELFNTHRPSETSDGRWHADSEAVWHLDENWFRTPGDTSADAAGLPILPGLVRPDEVLDAGVIDHALRFTVPRSRNAYVFPASHHAGSNNVNYPRMGERFRLKANFDISGFSPQNQVILRALKQYGMIVADNGSSWYISGQPSTRWNDDILSELKDILGSNFEAVELRPILSSLAQPSGSTAGGTAVTVQGLNFSGNAGKLKVFFGTTEAASVTIVSDTTLIATSPAHAAGTVDVTINTPYGTSAVTAADRFTFVDGSAATVAARRIFYNQSAWDGNSAAISFVSDAAAIAPDKSAYLPGAGGATAANFTSYSRGINGVIVDLTAGGNHSAISAGDFVFRMSDTSGANANTPQSWAVAPAPLGVQVSIGAGTGGSDRVEIVWVSGAIVNRWLQVQVKANANTGLASTFGTINGNAIGDIFFFGNRVGDGNGTFSSTNTDAGLALSNPGAATLTNPFDYDRNGSVTNADGAQALNGAGMLAKINIGLGGPFAPVGGGGAGNNDVGIASALAIDTTQRVLVGAGRPPQANRSADSSPTRDPVPLNERRAAIFLALATAHSEGVPLDTPMVSDNLLDDLLADLGKSRIAR